ncbi:MAG: ATP-binding protein [Bacteroidetes bacterium]|nr:ATP-binding protein [Bacteroidota bacterium]
MSEMLTEIRRVVDEDVSNRVDQNDVIYEAITNSIQSNATKIICSLHSYDNLTPENELQSSIRKVDNITIVDNGDGFNDDNYNSFCKYRSGFKKSVGGKGIGRFTFLKVYNKNNYTSKLFNEQEVRSFTFDRNFDTENLNKAVEKVQENLTEVSFISVTNQYLNEDRHLDRRIILNLNNIKEKVLLRLLPTLFFYKKTGVNIEIQFIEKDKEGVEVITHQEIPDFTKSTFKIRDKEGMDRNFILHHNITPKDGELYAFYCANNRTVCDFSSKDFKLSLPYGYSGFLLLEAKYLDEHVNNERNDFDIFPIKTDMFSTLSWDMINTGVKPKITEIVKAGIPETKQVNKSKLQDIQEERPYLINYIDDDDIDMAGFLDKKQLIDKAKKKFDFAKEKVLLNSGKDEYTDHDLHEAIQLTQNELVSYIFDRAQVIERLKAMLDKNEEVESIIHNLFMEQYTEDEYFCVNKNNLWLLDDRYTSYSYAASDKRIKDILIKLDSFNGDEEGINDKPDISLFFSHSPQNKNGLKSVIIELKPFDRDAKSDKKKFAGIQQLLDYTDALKEKERIEEIWAFLITDVDEKLSGRLIRDGYQKLFSTKDPIYHRKYENGVSIYVVSAKTLISDAEARNKVFLEIVKKQSKLSKILENIVD